MPRVEILELRQAHAHEAVVEVCASIAPESWAVDILKVMLVHRGDETDYVFISLLTMEQESQKLPSWRFLDNAVLFGSLD